MKLAYVLKNRFLISICILFCLFLFFRFYQLESRAFFGYDQVNNAWTALRILTEGKYPLLGMVAKGNSGMYIGPLYYYLITIFYFFSHLDPIASPIIAGATGIFTFATILFVSYRLFGKKVALATLSIYTVSEFIIRSERNQWPVNFIAPLSLLILYFLYRVTQGKSNDMIYLALCLGLAFHIHFTSIFYLFIILCTLPIIPWKKMSWKYVVISVAIFVICFIPQIIYYFQTKNVNATSNYLTYFQAYFHGLHFRRVLQIAHDAFIQFESVLLPFQILRFSVFYYLPIFIILSIRRHTIHLSWKLMYLITLWFIVPWVIMSTYSGELTDYYFFISQHLAIIIFGYITVQILESKYMLLRIGICLWWLVYAVVNIQTFMSYNGGDLAKNKIIVRDAMKQAKSFHFTEGDPQYYLYYIYSKSKK